MPVQEPRKGNLLAFPGVDPARFRAPGQEPPAAVDLPGSLPAESATVSAGDGYDGVFERLAERIVVGDRIAVSERIHAPIHYAELLSTPPGERLEKVEKDPRFHSYLLAEMLLERSREAWMDDANRATEAAELALEAARRLNADFYGSGLKEGLELRAWSYFANGLRLKGNLTAAEAAFEHVEVLLESAILDVYERAEALSLKTSLLRDQNRFEEAGKLLEEISAIYTEVGDRRKVAQTHILQSMTLAAMGSVEPAIAHLQHCLELIDENREPRLFSCALANLAVYLEQAGRNEEALEMLREAAPRMERQGDRLHLARVRWLEGRIADSQDQFERAEEAYQEVQRCFLERGADAEAATVCLELALLYARQGRNDEVRQVARQMLPLFQRERLDREVMAAVILFHHAAEKEFATLGLIEEIAKYLKRTRENPQVQNAGL